MEDERRSFGFGERLRSARLGRGLTQTELGIGTGENGRDAKKQSVVDWEKERHYPKADQLRAICLKLGVSADDLLFGDIKSAAAVATAESAVMALTEAQRLALIARLNGPAVSDHEVEQKMPAVKKARESR